MSLLDARLLDPAPFDVWISARTDGIKGSGTASDPYNGSDQTRFDGVMQTIAEQFPNQEVVIHLGCCQGTGRFVEAIRTFERVLTVANLPEAWKQLAAMGCEHSQREVNRTASPLAAAAL
jgi:hypothetical protein